MHACRGMDEGRGVMSSSLMCQQTQRAAMRLLPRSAGGVGRVMEVVLRRFRTEPAGCCHLADLYLAGKGGCLRDGVSISCHIICKQPTQQAGDQLCGAGWPLAGAAEHRGAQVVTQGTLWLDSVTSGTHPLGPQGTGVS